MRLLEHEHNSAWWSLKTGDATAAQVAGFAAEYKKCVPAAWAVAVTEGGDWISADHVRGVVALTRTAGAEAVWVSDGRAAQCVWRSP
jgi:hypothetical protein